MQISLLMCEIPYEKILLQPPEKEFNFCFTVKTKCTGNIPTNFEAFLTTIVAVEKQCVKQPQCVFIALGIQHAIRIRHVVIMTCPALQYFPTLGHKRHHFQKKKKSFIEHKMCVSISSTLFVRKISHSKNN